MSRAWDGSKAHWPVATKNGSLYVEHLSNVVWRRSRTRLHRPFVGPAPRDPRTGGCSCRPNRLSGCLREVLDDAHRLRSIRLLAAVLWVTVLAGVTFAQQQATLLGTLSGHTDPVTPWPGAPMARPSRRPGSTTRSGSERRPPGRRSRVSRGIPSWSWPWPSLPTADSSPRQAWTTPPRSGTSPAVDPPGP